MSLPYALHDAVKAAAAAVNGADTGPGRGAIGGDSPIGGKPRFFR